MRPKELRDLHDNLAALLEAGQAPVVEAILRQRFLLRISGEGESAWIAYGFLVARDLAHRLVSFTLEGIGPEEILRFREALLLGDRYEVPPYADPDRWIAARNRALRVLDEAEARLRRLLGGEGDGNGSGRAGGEGADGEEGRAVRVPVVARLRGNAHADPLFRDLAVGTVIRLTVEADGRMRSREKPEPGIGGNANEEVRRAFRSALADLPRLPVRSALPLERCDFDVRWDPPALLFGGSAALGFAVAAASAWTSLSPRPVEHRPASGSAFTGTLIGTRVAEVEETTLAHKVAACFYSSVRVLFVPASQEETARAAADELLRRHPARDFHVRAAADTREVWNDPDAVVLRRRPLARTVLVTARLFAASRWVLLIPALLLAAGAGLVARERALSDPNPVEAFWEGNCLVGVNKHGRETGRTAPAAGHPEHVYELGKDKKGALLAVHDLDGDGRREVIAACEDEPHRITLLTAFDGRLKPLWTKRADEVGGARMDGLEDFSWRCFYVLSGEEPGPATIFAFRQTTHRPLCLIGSMDGTSGEDLWVYRNYGHMEGIYFQDLDGDGQREYICLGTDNETGRGICSLIAAEEAPSPVGEGDWGVIPAITDPASIGAGVHYSLSFPLDRFARTRAHAKLFVEERRGLHRIWVMGNSECVDWGVSYYFDLRDLCAPRLLRVGFHEGPMANIMLHRPEFTPEDFHEEMERLSREVQVLTGEGWTPLTVAGESES